MEIKEVVASSVLIPAKTRSGKTPQNTYSSFVTTDASMKKRKLRNMFLPSEVAEEAI